jgi:adenosylmethionine-8-amino-7-oxononanoate aminotransferase
MDDPLDWQALLKYDRAHVWHPYAPMPGALASLPVVSASGVRLRLADGSQLIDGMSSWWAAIWGYRHPEIDAAIVDQVGRMSHVMFGGLTHAPAIELAKRLVKLAPPGLDCVFFADSGSVSVEVGLKACLQYQRNLGHPERSKFLALSGGYHGDTFGAMAVCDPVDGMHHLFAGTLPKNVFAPRPLRGPGADRTWELDLKNLAHRYAPEVAAIVAEPCVQGAGGMWFYDPAYVRVMREVATEHSMLLMLDEVATGFGRTGSMFAAESAGIAPDVMCVGKALTGGYMPLAAMMCTQRVAEVVSDGEPGCLMHGPTYMANPLACAAALASTGLFATEDWRRTIKRIEYGLLGALAPAANVRGVKDVRVLGAIGVLQLDHQVDIAAATAAATSYGVWLRPFNDLIYAMPPYISTDEDIAAIGAAMVAAAWDG